MEDLMQIEESLTSEEKAARDVVRRFVDSAVIPIIADAYEQGEFPRHLIKQCAELGLLGMTLPEVYGGANANAVTYGLVCQELERGDSGLRSFVSVQSALCMHPIYMYGSEQQKKKFLVPMAQGELIGCFGLTEPDVGSNPSEMKTSAKKVEGGWLLNGSKMWITNANFADLAIVWAKTDKGVRGFIVEKAFEGFTSHDIKHKMSLRASNTGELAFNDCFVPEGNLLPGSDKGLGAALSCLTQARYGIAWGAFGAAMACFDIALDYTQQRHQFDKPLASFQLIQKDLADMYTEICKGQLFNLHLAKLKDNNQLNHQMVSMAKMNACRESLNIARMARNLLGGNGISLEYHVIRHMMNLETVFTYEGTDNVHHLVLGNYLTGMNAFA